jgi:hypothetical protein
MAEEEKKDRFIPLVNPQGVIEQVWDFANHVETLLVSGWSKVDESVTKISKTEKER